LISFFWSVIVKGLVHVHAQRALGPFLAWPVAFGSTWIFDCHFDFIERAAFLVETHRVNSNIRVVEGWIYEYAIHIPFAGRRRNLGKSSYHRVFSTGDPVTGNGHCVNSYRTSASVGSEILENLGVPGDLVPMVPSRVIGRERTYSANRAARLVPRA
jgi:hypothetical protein